MAVYALRVLAPANFCVRAHRSFPWILSGIFYHGPNSGSPRSLKQIVNAVVSIVCAGILYSYGMSLAQENGNELLGPAWGAAGATFGTVVSVTVALIFVMIIYTLQKRTLSRQIRRDHTERRESEAHIYRTLILTILPIILSTLIYNISNIAGHGDFQPGSQQPGLY